MGNTTWNRETFYSKWKDTTWPKDSFIFKDTCTVLSYRKLIHHRKETLARRSSTSSGPKQGIPSSNSEISLSQTPPPPNGLSRDCGRQGSMPLSGSMDNMQGDPGCYQVTQSPVHRKCFGWSCLKRQKALRLQISWVKNPKTSTFQNENLTSFNLWHLCSLNKNVQSVQLFRIDCSNEDETVGLGWPLACPPPQVPPQPRRAAPITPPPPEKQRNSLRAG